MKHLKSAGTQALARSLARRARGAGGYSLISLSLFVIGFGIILTAGSMVYNQWQKAKAPTVTAQRIAALENAMQGYLALHGHYPCPASLTAAPDSAEFGVEMKEAADPEKCTGQFSGTGTEGRLVWTGAVPVRTMNLPDEMMLDGWDHRIAFAVTEIYTGTAPPLNSNKSAIKIIDVNGNNATSTQGNITYAFLTTGGDESGAYSASGALIAPCDTSTPSGRNCAFETGDQQGVFVNTAMRSHTMKPDQFTHRVDYRMAPISMCVEKGASKAPKNIAYLVDTSKSMEEDGGCPPSLGPKCSRIDVARWALRRVVPVRLVQNEPDDNNDPDHPPQTMMTGFVDDSKNVTAKSVDSKLGDINVKDESSVIDQIDNLCPSGSTPLGAHIEALADRIQDGTPDRPNKIMVISDGISNRGEDPVSVAQRIHEKYPNLQVDIIDVTGTPELEQVATITGGSYSLSLSGDKILDSMLNLSGVCGDFTPPTHPVDKKGCGSSGGWWN
jgi:hypothetical protein